MSNGFPYDDDSLSRDYFISQFIGSLHKAADANGDNGDWFGRVIGWSPGTNSQKYSFKLGNDVFSMEEIVELVKNRDLVFEFSNITGIGYRTVDNVEYADVTADVVVTDNRGITPTELYNQTQVTFTHKIKPTFQTYETFFP